MRFFPGFFLPERCPLCGKGIPADGIGGMFCRECLLTMRFVHGTPCPVCGGDINGIFSKCPDCMAAPARPWERGYSVFRYEGGAAEAVRKFKYGGNVSLARPLGRLLAGVVEKPERYDAIVPVPLHWFRFLQRGYNQSVLLGEELSRRTGIPLVRGLVRIRNTKHQAFLEKEERMKNLRGAFRTRKPETLKGRRILLIDDVMTTGSTLAECAELLTGAGAAVDIAVVARRQTRL